MSAVDAPYWLRISMHCCHDVGVAPALLCTACNHMYGRPCTAQVSDGQVLMWVDDPTDDGAASKGSKEDKTPDTALNLNSREL